MREIRRARAHVDDRLLDSHREVSSSETALLLKRQRATSTSVYRITPDVFPLQHPFALLAEVPPPSLLDKRVAAEDGLPTSETLLCGSLEVTVVIFTLILSAPRHNMAQWLTELLDIEGRAATSTIIHKAFDLCSRTIRNETFPAQWLTLNLLCLNSMIRLLDPVAEMLETSFVPSVGEAGTFDVDLWRSVFDLLCDYCGNAQLSLEDLTQQRRRAQWIIAGDLRDDAAILLLRLWSAIGWEGEQKGGIKHGGVGLIDCLDLIVRGADISIKLDSLDLRARSWNYASPVMMAFVRLQSKCSSR